MKLYNYLLGWRRWDIRKHDIVLEVGSGGNPMVRSNILIDKFIDWDGERELKIAIDDRPLICAEAENLPFKDNTFNFVYTSHVLEHIANIEKTLAEITRVGEAGLIIVPGEIFERAWDKGTHKWIINKNNGKLIFKNKCECTKLQQCDTLGKWKGIFWKIYVKNRSFLDVHFLWKKHIPFKIIRCEANHEPDNNNIDYSEPINRQVSLKKKWKQKILIVLARIIRLVFT